MIWRLELIHETQCNRQFLLLLIKNHSIYKLLCLRHWVLYLRVVATHIQFSMYIYIYTYIYISFYPLHFTSLLNLTKSALQFNTNYIHMINAIKVQQRSYVSAINTKMYEILNLKYIKLAMMENIFTHSSNKNKLA